VKALCFLVLAVVVATVACSDGEKANIGLGEPLQVPKAQFIPGPLPGAPFDPDASAVTTPEDAGADSGSPPAQHLVVTTATVPAVAYAAGTAGIPLTQGRVTSDAVAVGVRFADLGTGYWVLPIGLADQLFPGENDFSMSFTVSPSVPPGNHFLIFAAIDGEGHAGQQFGAALCIDTAFPDNHHACIPANPLPSAVFSLVWDANFDLDLHVTTPEGLDLNAKTLPNAAADGGPMPGKTCPPNCGAQLDRDSLGHCIPDGIREEDLYWPASTMPGMPNVPTHGNYYVYVDPFASCGAPAVRFTFTLYTLQGTCPDCRLVPHKPVSGELLSSQVTGGSSPPTFVTQYSL
jgi:hypothetical protein